MVEGRHQEVVLSKGDDAAAACISLTKKADLKCESKSDQIKMCLCTYRCVFKRACSIVKAVIVLP
jgi:hypothetical protein